MSTFRTLRLSLLALAGLAASSCLSPPEYSDTPSISFKELKIVRQPSNPGDIPVDSMTVTINFEDGDGDLGLSEAEYSSTSPPYNRTNTNGSTNINHWNYYIKLFVKNTSGQFEPYTVTPDFLTIDPTAYYGQFPHLEPNADKKAPLKGTLSFKQAFALGSPFYPDQEVRFEISIRDRALHLSNTVVSNSFIVRLN